MKNKKQENDRRTDRQRTRPQSARQKEISRLITPYKQHWEAWTKSKHCCFTEQEVHLIELLLAHGNLSSAVRSLKISTNKTGRLYSHIKRKLISYQRYYKKWEKEIFSANLNKTKSGRLYKKAEFLNASFYSRYFPAHLGKLLSAFGENLFEVLIRCEKKKFLEKRGFGKKRMAEFEILLKQYGCADFLRSD